MELTSALQFLKLHEITNAWVNDAWDLEFTEIRPLDVFLEEELTAFGENFLNLYQSILKYADPQQSADSDEASQNIWAYLGENNVSVKTLVAVLSFFILSGKNKKARVEQRLNSLHAASLYLLLLGMPGSIANKVFHEILFDTCLDLSSHCWPENSGKKRKKDSSKPDGKRSRPQRKDLTTLEEEGEEEEEDLPLSASDLIKIRNALFLLLQSLLKLLETLSLRDRPQSLINCTRILSNLLYFEPVIGEIEFTPVKDITKLKSVPEMAFYGLQLLCSPKHGEQKESLRRVFHQLLYVILMMSKGNRKKPTPLVINQAILSTRDQTISFVCYLANELKELAMPFLHILLQHICFQMVEKSEFRSHGAQAVSMLTSEMTNTDYARFVRWLLNFTRHPKMACRLFAVDVAVALLEQPERKPEEGHDPESAQYLHHKLLIQSLLSSGQMDESPTVQGHALSSLAKCLEIPSMNVTQAIHNLFNESGNSTVHEDENTQGSISVKQKTYRSLTFRTVEVGSDESLGNDAKTNLALLFRRVKDSRTSVRKSALQALMGLLKHDVIPVNSDNLFVLSERCRDPAVSVRKKTLQCMGELLTANPGSIAVQKAWLQGVVPVVLDSENTVQDKALEALEERLLLPIKSYSSSSHQDTLERLAWDLLVLLCHDCKHLNNYLGKAFSIWSKQNKFTPSFITKLISHTEAEHASGAWLLLSKIGSFSGRPSLEKIMDAWDKMVSSREVNVTVCCHILCVIGNIAAHLNEDTKDRMINDLMSRLKSFDMSLEVISAAVDTLYQLGRNEDIKQTQEFLNKRGGELVAACEEYLASVLLNENGAQNLNEDQMVKHLHTLGVVSLHCPTRVGKRTVLLVESVLTTNSDKLKDVEDKLPTSQPLSQFRTNALPTTVRAQGVLTLGKLCLQQEELVQKYLPVFARELEVGTEMAVRNNVVIIMCDLCVRYTAIVDHYIPNISACLRDSEAVIREQTLIMLTNLLQEEFVKWKGSLFFRFMVALVDPEPAIASLCKYCLLHLLLKKNPEMFSQHFIECIFHLNCYDKHKSYKFPQSESEKLRFSLKGAELLEKRFEIYRFLLEHFTDAQRFNLSNKINHTILACFADEELPLDEDGSAILSETFKILSLKEIKIQVTSGPAGGGAGEEGDEENDFNMAKAVLQTAQRKLVSQVQKRAFIENTVPIIINLKSILEQKRSTVMKDLMSYLQVIMKDFRSEVREFFSGDEQLAEELEFALKNAENNREMEENCPPAGEARTPTAKTVPQDIVLNSPVRTKPILRENFATPQPQRPSPLSTRLTQTERRTYKPKEVSHNQTVQFSFEKTVLSRNSIQYRAISTPKVGQVNLTFEDGTSPILSDRKK